MTNRHSDGEATSAMLPITLFSTVDMASDRHEMLERMIDSVSNYRRRSGCDLVLLILLQRCSAEAASEFSSTHPDWIRVFAQNDLRSLSKARNLLLTSAESRDRLEADGIVAFPDDDCWYPDGTLDAIQAAFLGKPSLDFWFCRYGMSAQAPAAAFENARPGLQMAISRASSNTIFVRSGIAKKIGLFDEKLGVGAQLSGGEDTDYAIRAYQNSRAVVFVNSKCVGHREFSGKLKARYYPGSLYAIAKNTRFRPFELMSLGRKLFVGCWLIVRGGLSPQDYVSAIAMSFTRSPKSL